MSEVLVREATATDLPGIAAAFREVVAEGETYCYPDGLTDEQIADEWLLPAPWRVAVAYAVDGTFLGVAKSGPNRPGRGAHISTASFIVSAAARGHRVGRLLGEHIIAWARENGYAAMQFNAVVETNTGAVRLWQDLGFRILGTTPGAFDSLRHGRVGLHVMWLDLRADDGHELGPN
jgi:L-amino acid N-acyltransferase YncA